ncbi:MAG: PKD domain-containing protein [Candidatus Latescibacteria bacterium]|nr:PKD domain-containing protein [Candidatus Latescibacterota bacterium]
MKVYFSLLFLFLLTFSLFARTEGVYGNDNRRYVYNTPDDDIYSRSEYMQLARSICLLVPNSLITKQWGTGTGNPVLYPSGGFDLAVSGSLKDFILQNFSQYAEISDDTRFKDDIVVGNYDIGTGVMIGDRQILTVDHIFKNIDPSGYTAIFNWIEKPSSPTSVINFDSYYCFNIVGYDSYQGNSLKQISLTNNSADKMDISIIKTDRIMDKTNGNIPPLNIYNFPDVKDKLVGKELFMIGHCMGLPQVLTDDACINTNITFEKANLMGIKNLVDPSQNLTQAQFDHLGFANLDGFSGNSGSPVFVKDDTFGWNIVGLYTGGPNDYKPNSTLVIKEHLYTVDDFNQNEAFEHFQILEGLTRYKRICTDDCDYIQIPEKVIQNPLIKGEFISLRMPRNIADGVYYVIFASGVGRKVVYFSGEPIPSVVRGFVQNGQNYDINMVNPKTQQIAYNFHKSGTAQGEQIKTGMVFNVNPNSDGLLTDQLNFIPNIDVGEDPLVVNFNAYFPDPEYLSSCLWEFGDGSTSNLMYPCYTYTTPGVYTVNLTVQYHNSSTESFNITDCIEVLDSKDLVRLNGEIKKYPIIGKNNVTLNDRAKCIDFNQFNMPIACLNGNINIGSRATSGRLICRGGVWLRDYAEVDGDIICGATIVYQNNVSVSGETEINAIISADDLPVALAPISDFSYASDEITGDIFIEPGNIHELTPGKYYNYNIKSNSNLRLSSGVYYFNNLLLEVGSSLELIEDDGPVRVYIKSNIDFKGSIVHSLEGAVGPSNFLIGYCGTNRIYLDYGFSGTFVSPEAPLVIGQAYKSYEGCFYARTVEVHQEAIIKYIPYAY